MALIKRNTAYALNDIVYTTFGVKLKCITAGITDTNPLNLPPPHSYISIIDGTVTWEVVEENHVSIGTIISYMGNTVPERFLACDGTIYNIADYQSLAEHINTQFGSKNFFGGDGITTFAVPDLRGEFLRGTGTNSHTNQGNGANVGVHQNATENPWIYFYFENPANMLQLQGVSGQNSIKNSDSIPSWSKKYANVSYSAPTEFSQNLTASYTSRPTNTSVLYCIKYI